MNEHHEQQQEGGRQRGSYIPPRVVVLGTVAELTQKTAGAADGAVFLGIDIGT